MKIIKNDQHKFRSHNDSSPKLTGASMAFFILICLSSTAAVLFSSIQAGRYIHQRYTSWKRLTVSEMWEHFECEGAFATTRPWWTPDQWREVRDIYRAFAKENEGGTFQMAENVLELDFNQIAEPFQAGKEKGRGLKAARDIRHGEIVLRTTNNTVVFNDELVYRNFLFVLEERFPTFACDIMMWNWMQDLDNEGLKFGMVVDLNDNNLINRPDKTGDANVMCGAPPVTSLVSWLMWPPSLFYGKEEDSCDLKNLTFYASRDIRKGEELLGEYSDFESSHSYDEMGL